MESVFVPYPSHLRLLRSSLLIAGTLISTFCFAAIRCNAQTADTAVAAGTEAPLKLPEHRERTAKPPKPAAPKAARPSREQHRTAPTRHVRTGSRMPMPGRPARRLPPLGEQPEAHATPRSTPTPQPKKSASSEKNSNDHQKLAAANESAPVPPTPDDVAADEADRSSEVDATDEDEEGQETEEEAEEEEEDIAEEPAEDPGLILALPHEFCDQAITAEYVYTGESYTLAKGGLLQQRQTNYRGNMDVVLTFDFEKLGLWKGGRFFLYSNHVHGRPMSATDVGDLQLFSNIDSTIGTTPSGGLDRPYYTAVGEYWLEQLLYEDLVRVKVGKQDSNADFAFADLGGDFVNSSFALPPMIPLPTWPSQALGESTFWTILDDQVVSAGVYDGTLASGPQGVRWGFDTLGHNGAISLYQWQWTPKTGPGGEHPRTVRVGAWHHSDKEVWTSFDANPVTFNQNYGYWASVDQMLWKEEYGTENEQGLSIFGQFGYAPEDRNLIHESVVGGVVYKGLLPDRDDDLFGIGFNSILISQSYRDFSLIDSGTIVGPRETVVEGFYKIIVSPYFSLQPDVQYIATPSGQYKDALLPGVRFELVL